MPLFGVDSYVWPICRYHLFHIVSHSPTTLTEIKWKFQHGFPLLIMTLKSPIFCACSVSWANFRNNKITTDQKRRNHFGRNYARHTCRMRNNICSAQWITKMAANYCCKLLFWVFCAFEGNKKWQIILLAYTIHN